MREAKVHREMSAKSLLRNEGGLKWPTASWYIYYL